MNKTHKTLFYNSNGTGRDSYIWMNNGGHAFGREENKQPPPGTMRLTETHNFYKSPYMHSKPVQYISNGGGRDSYICSSAGGLNNPYAPGTMVDPFYCSLRSGGPSTKMRSLSTGYRPRRVPVNKQRDLYQTSQGHLNTAQARVVMKQSYFQKRLDNRLSVPKYRRRKVIP